MDKEESILIVDDTETNIDILLELLNGYDLLVALDGESAIEIINEEKIDLILLDIMMPNMNGYEVCKILKSNPKTKELPIIFLTAKTDEESIERAYDIGGVDYITKPFKPKELLARVKTQLDNKKMIKELEFLASYDPLTTIYNRKNFFELGIKQFNLNKKNLYAIIIEIDKFKQINDKYSHLMGDEVIKIVVKSINQNILKDSIFGRVDGNEFAILCSGEENIVLENIKNIKKIVEKIKVISENGESLKFTISEGVAKINENFKTLDNFLKQAYDSLYEIKKSKIHSLYL